MVDRVTLVEVAPRDGLQNEPVRLTVAEKIRLIEGLAAAGLPVVEAGAFVSPKWVPQMADSAEVLHGLTRRPGVRYPVLTPNLKGYQAARAAGAEAVAVFAAASETFSRRNINCSIAESLARFAPVLAAAKADRVPVRGYVSCVLGCPYEGPIAPAAVAAVAAALYDRGCDEISLGDTIGTGTPTATRTLLAALAQSLPIDRLAAHFHDTYGQALANILTALDAGVRIIDTAVTGLGGCPYAKGASGNVATEDVLFMLDGMGLVTGVDQHALLDVSAWLSTRLDRPPVSKAARALLAGRAGRAPDTI